MIDIKKTNFSKAREFLIKGNNIIIPKDKNFGCSQGLKITVKKTLNNKAKESSTNVFQKQAILRVFSLKVFLKKTKNNNTGTTKIEMFKTIESITFLKLFSTKEVPEVKEVCFKIKGFKKTIKNKKKTAIIKTLLETIFLSFLKAKINGNTKRANEKKLNKKFIEKTIAPKNFLFNKNNNKKVGVKKKTMFSGLSNAAETRYGLIAIKKATIKALKFPAILLIKIKEVKGIKTEIKGKKNIIKMFAEIPVKKEFWAKST
jgi:hypothetical protein